MNLLPTTSSNRPRTACEIAPEGLVAARSGEPAGTLAAVSRIVLPPEAVLPGLRPGNVIHRVAVIAGIRRALEGVGVRPNSRGSEITLIIPDGAARVLLLDFDMLPSKLSEALPIVRFRLKKLLPFEADDAMISYQVMSTSRGLVRVLAVAMPRDVLAEYETAVREAGFEPGAVLPSTLAALPGVPVGEPALLLNGSRLAVTTAILNAGTLLLHRTVDLQNGPAATPAAPLAGDDSAEAAQAPTAPQSGSESTIWVTPSSLSSMMSLEHDLAALAGKALGTGPSQGSGDAWDQGAGERLGQTAEQNVFEQEIVQAVSVATAYFEDTLSRPPRHLWSTGSLPAETVAGVLRRHGLLAAEGLDVRELVSGPLLEGSSISPLIPRHTLAGVAGALRG